MAKGLRKAKVQLRMPQKLKSDLEGLWGSDPRTFSSLSDFLVYLLEEAALARLPAKEVARRQREAAMVAERKVG